MKGILKKTEKGWVVEFLNHARNNNDFLPVRPQDEELCKEGKNVEFEIVRSMSHGNGLSIGNYALILLKYKESKKTNRKKKGRPV